MATLYITEGKNLANGPYQEGIAQMMTLPPVAEQTKAIGASSVQTSAFNATTNLIRVHTDTDCHIAVGSNPTATISTLRLVAGTTEYFGVKPGHKLAVIEA